MRKILFSFLSELSSDFALNAIFINLIFYVFVNFFHCSCSSVFDLTDRKNSSIVLCTSVPAKDTDSGCSVTSNPVEEEVTATLFLKEQSRRLVIVFIYLYEC
jgi:hypothetical protein